MSDARGCGAEHRRLEESPRDDDPWRLWGPYVSGRQWGTVREDYSPDGDAWDSFPFDHAHRRAYRWGEDGLAGLCDRYGFLNLGLALWNEHDDRLKERLFGLTNPEGNHGEDVKEYWWPTDATPTHSYASWLYRYPQAAYPYEDLRATNRSRTRLDPEYELSDTGVLDERRYFDVTVTHAKAGPSDVCVVVEATNKGPEAAPLHLVPQLWFRNTWAWGRDPRTPSLRLVTAPEHQGDGVLVEARHDFLGRYYLAAEGEPRVLCCDNETDAEALWGATNRSPYPKDGVDRAVVRGDLSAINPAMTGTKVGLDYRFDAVPPGATMRIRLRLAADAMASRPFGHAFDAVLADRRAEADEFYASVIPHHVGPDDRHTARRAFAGLLWGRQLYRYDVRQWLQGDPAGPVPPVGRTAREPAGRNTCWQHLSLADVISMPDEWEYPWFASWDLAFHAVTLAHVDPDLSKAQLLLMCREWAQHPDGQLPAYEWNFSDVNPPVHAWAAWQVYVIDGCRDRAFLVRILTKLLLNMGWWFNRKDVDGSDLFEGGFLGMDNIGLFDRSRDVPDGSRLEQSDATSWVAFACLSMLRIALELAREDGAYDEIATTFLERFLHIASAMTAFGSGAVSLWDDEDGFFYDALVHADGTVDLMRVRTLVGLVPVLAVLSVPDWVQHELPDVTARLRWLQTRRPELTLPVQSVPPAAKSAGSGVPVHDSVTLALVDEPRLRRLLERMLDEGEFLSPYGIRSLSAAYRDGITEQVGDQSLTTRYVPGESDSGLFGGNSNWRGPVWFPLNVLFVDALAVYASSGRALDIALPTAGGASMSVGDAAQALADRLVSLFRPGPDGRRPSTPRDHLSGPDWSDHPTFSEYFHGDTGQGLGASHQTGWTAFVAHLICSPTRHVRPGDGPPTPPERDA